MFNQKVAVSCQSLVRELASEVSFPKTDVAAAEKFDRCGNLIAHDWHNIRSPAYFFSCGDTWDSVQAVLEVVAKPVSPNFSRVDLILSDKLNN